MPDQAVTSPHEEGTIEQAARAEQEANIRYAISRIKCQINELRTHQRALNKDLLNPECNSLKIRDLSISASRQMDSYINKLIDYQAMLAPHKLEKTAGPKKAKRQSFAPGAHLSPIAAFAPPATPSPQESAS